MTWIIINYYVVPLSVDEKLDNVVIRIGSNDIRKFNYNNVNAEELPHKIRNIGLKCRSYGVSNTEVSSILKRSSFNINQVIYQVNNVLKRSCRINVPLDETIGIIIKRIYDKKEINTGIPKKEMRELLYLCTKSFTLSPTLHH